MAIQNLITGELKIRHLNGVLIATDGIVDSVGNITSGTAGTSGTLVLFILLSVTTAYFTGLADYFITFDPNLFA